MEEKITSTVQEKESLEEESLAIQEVKLEVEKKLIKKQYKKQYKKQLKKQAKLEKKQNGRQVVLKITATISWLIITVIALYFEIWTAVDSISLLKNPDAGLDRLAFIVLLPMMIVVPVAALVAYIAPFIISLIGFIKSFKKAKKITKTTGKIWFGLLIALIVIIEFILIATSVALILAIKFCQ